MHGSREGDITHVVKHDWILQTGFIIHFGNNDDFRFHAFKTSYRLDSDPVAFGLIAEHKQRIIALEIAQVRFLHGFEGQDHNILWRDLVGLHEPGQQGLEPKE